jgi:hypothetical protein
MEFPYDIAITKCHGYPRPKIIYWLVLDIFAYLLPLLVSLLLSICIFIIAHKNRRQPIAGKSVSTNTWRGSQQGEIAKKAESPNDASSCPIFLYPSDFQSCSSHNLHL